VVIATVSFPSAVMRVDINLQQLCIELIASWLRSAENVVHLPLPNSLKDRLKQYISE